MTPHELRRRIERLEARPRGMTPEEAAIAATVQNLSDEGLDQLIRETLGEHEASPAAQAFAAVLAGLSDQELEAHFTRSGPR